MIVAPVRTIPWNDCMSTKIVGKVNKCYSAHFVNFYFPIWSYISCNELQWKHFLILDKKQFLWILKTWKSYFLAVYLCRWSHDQHAQSCDIDSRTCDFRFDLSRLFYLCKVSFVVHAKGSFPAFCMDYKAKFIEIKPTRWVKPEAICSWIYVTTLSMLILWSAVCSGSTERK